jgi:hypothetical protein
VDHRHLTFIVVPHADLETRSFTVSYGRLKLLVASSAALLLVFVMVVSTWWYVAAQAARATSLEREVQRLESERANVARLARELEQVESQYEHVRQLLGADAPPAKGKEPVLPPIGSKASPPPPTPTNPSSSAVSEAAKLLGLDK